jgi:hypothetical protein
MDLSDRTSRYFVLNGPGELAGEKTVDRTGVLMEAVTIGTVVRCL